MGAGLEMGRSTKCERCGAQEPVRSVGGTVCACGCGGEQAGHGAWSGREARSEALQARLKVGFILQATGRHRGNEPESEEVGCVLQQCFPT